MTREELRNAKRIVCKIGTQSVLKEVDGKNKFNYETMFALAREVAELQSQGKEFIWVTSGAIGLGNAELNRERSSELVQKQVASAVGQPILMSGYQTVFGHYGVKVGQVLLTPQDVPDRQEAAKVTIETMLASKVLPVLNENDVVSTEEITYGDNDILAARKAKLLSADALILLSHIKGIYRPGTIDVISQLLDAEIETYKEVVGEEHSKSGSGGASSKLQAPLIAKGIPVIVACAYESRVIQSILEGKSIGTLLESKK